ncbi:MAG: hypothetical protein WKF62_06380 [Solirubrobacterales bacterium]
MWRFFAILGACVLVALAMASSASACSCAEPTEPETLEGYDAAITARLVDVVPVQGDRERLIYRVLRVYKGMRRFDEGDIFQQTNDKFSSCQIPSREGRRYGLRLRKFRHKLTTSACAKFGPKSLREAAQRSGNARSAVAAGCGSQA